MPFTPDQKHFASRQLISVVLWACAGLLLVSTELIVVIAAVSDQADGVSDPASLPWFNLIRLLVVAFVAVTAVLFTPKLTWSRALPSIALILLTPLLALTPLILDATLSLAGGTEALALMLFARAIGLAPFCLLVSWMLSRRLAVPTYAFLLAPLAVYIAAVAGIINAGTLPYVGSTVIAIASTTAAGLAASALDRRLRVSQVGDEDSVRETDPDIE